MSLFPPAEPHRETISFITPYSPFSKNGFDSADMFLCKLQDALQHGQISRGEEIDEAAVIGFSAESVPDGKLARL